MFTVGSGNFGLRKPFHFTERFIKIKAQVRLVLGWKYQDERLSLQSQEFGGSWNKL
jgi:hypothetical protein